MIQIYNFFVKNQTIVHISLLCAMVLALSTKGITDESVVSMNGDMPKYLMNGVYFYDLLNDMPVKNPIEHAYRYFAQYPALSLGHHPMLLGIAEVPFYAVFGISVFSARLCIVLFMLICAISMYFLVRLIQGETIALIASCLFTTTPFIVKYSRIVMPEIQAIALIILATYFLYKYCGSEKKHWGIAAGFTLILSIFAKHLAVFMVPVFLIYLLSQKGIKKLVTKKLMILYLIVAILVIPFAFITLKFAKFNISWITQISLDTRLSLPNLVYFPKILWKEHLTLPVLIFSLISLCFSIKKRDKKSILFLLWVVSLYLFLTGLGIQKGPRYAIYWIPAFCVYAATVVTLFRQRYLKSIVTVLLFAVVFYQFVLSFKTNPHYMDGYDQAAKYITANLTERIIFFSGVNDTSYLIFFIRKYDPERRFIVLRSDKILATSLMSSINEDRIGSRDEIYKIFNSFGIRYVVVEETSSESRALEMLRREVKSSNFEVINKFNLTSSMKIFNNVPLVIYEYRDYTPYHGNEVLQMDIPLIGKSISVPFEQLLKKQ